MRIVRLPSQTGAYIRLGDHERGCKETAHRPCALWVVVVAVDGEDGYGDVDVLVLVVDMAKGTVEDFCGIAHELQLDRPEAETVLADASHDLVHGLAGGFVLVEEVAAEEDHVDLQQ